MAADIRVRLRGDKDVLKKLQDAGVKVGQVLEAAVTAAAVVVEDAANSAAPGPNIHHATHIKTDERCVVHVGPDKDHWYYTFAEFGATPHVITGEPLAFEGRSGVVFTRRVQHPGRPPAPFLRSALDTEGERARDAMGEVWEAELKAV